jgi:hypothetical protein
MGWRIFFSSFWYVLINFVTLLPSFLVLTLVQIYLNPLLLKSLISLSGQSKLLTSMGIYFHSLSQLLVWVGILLWFFSLFILNVMFNYDGYAARLICKKTKPLTTLEPKQTK